MIGAEEESILVLNVGSSTVKFGFFALHGNDDPLIHGVLYQSGAASGQVRLTDRSGRTETRELGSSHADGVAGLLRALEENSVFTSVRAVGHRLVHGGSLLTKPVALGPAVRAMLDDVIPLAPDHLPAELRAIDEISRRHSALPQFACFDTAFHAGLPAVARTFGLPRGLSDAGVVRYGFHGLSYEYVITSLRERGELPRRAIIAHLGSGASLAAILDGASVDTSMGMTPGGGLVMSTRSGDLDPGVLLYLMRARNYSSVQIDETVNRSGGLLGISQTTGDVRQLLAAAPADPRAREAIDIFCYQITKFIGAYAAALGGLDLLVFTGGIGEHAARVRAGVCERLGFLGIRIEPALNEADQPLISVASTSVAVRIVKTREEVMIARHVRAALGLQSER